MRLSRSCSAAALIAASLLPAAARAQGVSLDNLQIHGYLTQGFTKSQEAGLGIPKDVSADYRSAALLFRYAMSDNDNAVVQIRHRRLGVGAYAASEPNVELNWAFYQHKFGGGFGIRGTADDPATRATIVYNVRMDNTYGGQVWWNTPVSGLRVGVGAMNFQQEKATDTSTTPRSSAWHGSVDGQFARVTIRGEYSNSAYGTGMNQGYYVQGGVQVTNKLQVNVQNDFHDERLTTAGIDRKWRGARDFAVGANYVVNPGLSLKVESHDAKFQDGIMSVLMGRPAQKKRYVIASVSSAF